MFPHSFYALAHLSVSFRGILVLQDELNRMRQELVNMVDPPEPEQVQEEDEGQQQQQQNLLATSPVRGGPQDMDMESEWVKCRSTRRYSVYQLQQNSSNGNSSIEVLGENIRAQPEQEQQALQQVDIGVTLQQVQNRHA